MIEDHAEELTHSAVEDLKTNAKTPSFHTLSEEELHLRAYEVYHNLSRWLLELSDDAIGSFHRRMAKHRFEEGVPLSEMVFALTLKKYHLRDFVRASGLVDSAIGLMQEQELHHLIGSFFDKAIYYSVKGFEEAGNESTISTVTRIKL